MCYGILVQQICVYRFYMCLLNTLGLFSSLMSSRLCRRPLAFHWSICIAIIIKQNIPGCLQSSDLFLPEILGSSFAFKRAVLRWLGLWEVRMEMRCRPPLVRRWWQSGIHHGRDGATGVRPKRSWPLCATLALHCTIEKRFRETDVFLDFECYSFFHAGQEHVYKGSPPPQFTQWGFLSHSCAAWSWLPYFAQVSHPRQLWNPWPYTPGT